MQIFVTEKNGSMKMKYFIIITLIIIISFSCKSDSDSVVSGVPVNHAPVVQDILLNPPSPLTLIGQFVETEMTGVATDADGDSLSYAWSATGGDFYAYPAINRAYWRVNNIGTYIITCIANDGKAIGSKTVTLTVTQ